LGDFFAPGLPWEIRRISKNWVTFWATFCIFTLASSFKHDLF
jgi:hypothetical protein